MSDWCGPRHCTRGNVYRGDWGERVTRTVLPLRDEDGPAHSKRQSTPCCKHGTSRGRGSHFLTVIKNSKHFGRPPGSMGLLVKQNGVWAGTRRPGTETSLLAQYGSWVAFREQCPQRRSREQALSEAKTQGPPCGIARAPKVLVPSAGTHRHTTASTVGRPFQKSGQLSSPHVRSAPPLPGPGSTPVLVGDRPTPHRTGQGAEEMAPVCSVAGPGRDAQGCRGHNLSRGTSSD